MVHGTQKRQKIPTKRSRVWRLGFWPSQKKNEKIKKFTCGARGPGVGGAESAGVWGWDSTQGDVGGSAV